MKQAKNPKDIPEGNHYAVLIFNHTEVYIPGDERSRTNPGHGYPERTETYHTYEYHYTSTYSEWVNYIETLEKSKEHIPYAALEVKFKAKVDIETKVVLK